MLKTVLIALIAISFVSVAYAANDYTSIIRSDMCVLVKCVNVTSLLKYDTSNQKVSGKFVMMGDDFVRAKGMKNSIEYYRLDNKPMIFVEPDQATIKKSKHLIIMPNLDKYVLAGQKNKKQLDSFTDVRYISKGMYANPNCSVVTIGIKQITIDQGLKYLKDGCPQGANPFVDKIVTNKTKITYCGNDCQYKKNMAEAKKKSKTTVLLPIGKTK